MKYSKSIMQYCTGKQNDSIEQKRRPICWICLVRLKYYRKHIFNSEINTHFNISSCFIYIYIYIYILDDLATLRCGTVWLHGWGISVFTKTTVSTLLSVIISIGRPFPHPTFTGARGAHKRHQVYSYSFHRVQYSYQLFWKAWFDTILLLFLHVAPSNPRPYIC